MRGYWFLVTLGVDLQVSPLGIYWYLLFEGTLGSGEPVLTIVTLGSGCRVAYWIWFMQRYYWFGWVWYCGGSDCWI